MRSEDGGRTWTTLWPRVGIARRPSEAARLDAIAVTGDGAVVLAAGERIVATTDAGATWREHGVAPLRSAGGAWTSRREMLVFGEGGVLLRSTDGGQRFAPVPTGTKRQLFAAWGNGERELFVGGTGVLLASSDGGATFRSEGTGAGTMHVALWGAASKAGVDVYAGTAWKAYGGGLVRRTNGWRSVANGWRDVVALGGTARAVYALLSAGTLERTAR